MGERSPTAGTAAATTATAVEEVDSESPLCRDHEDPFADETIMKKVTVVPYAPQLLVQKMEAAPLPVENLFFRWSFVSGDKTTSSAHQQILTKTRPAKLTLPDTLTVATLAAASGARK